MTRGRPTASVNRTMQRPAGGTRSADSVGQGGRTGPGTGSISFRLGGILTAGRAVVVGGPTALIVSSTRSICDPLRTPLAAAVSSADERSDVSPADQQDAARAERLRRLVDLDRRGRVVADQRLPIRMAGRGAVDVRLVVQAPSGAAASVSEPGPQRGEPMLHRLRMTHPSTVGHLPPDLHPACVTSRRPTRARRVWKVQKPNRRRTATTRRLTACCSTSRRSCAHSRCRARQSTRRWTAADSRRRSASGRARSDGSPPRSSRG